MSAPDPRIELESFFESGNTLDIKFRIEQLKKLKRVIVKNEKRILRALSLDLRKPLFESYIAEVGQCLKEIDYILSNLKSWLAPRSTDLPIYMLPGKAQVHLRPLGKVLIISPWNYPFQLALIPAIGALAAGNVVLIKPSEFAPETSKVLREILNENFPRGLINVLEGGVELSTQLLSQQWDHIFFTGSTRVGKIVMQKAAEHLTPVTLELGGKSPAWIDATANFETSLKRILWGKFSNAGQTCIAPDYLILHKKHESKLKELAQKIITGFYGTNPMHSPDYARIVNEKHVDRLDSYLDFGTAIVGGESAREHKYFAPTILTDVKIDSPLMREEIFGPILPVITYEKEAEVYDLLKLNPKPLAFYLFSEDKRLQEKIIEQLQFGGGVINDTLIHWGIDGFPLGGVGPSGMGCYHGKNSIETFSHSKAVISKWSWPDPNFRYPPYGDKYSLLRKIFR